MTFIQAATQPRTPTVPGPQLRESLQRVFDRGYRDLIEHDGSPERLQTICRGIAETLGLPLVGVVRRGEGGLMRMEAASCENRLWVEFNRLPERWDGTIAGHGPAVQALQSREVAIVSVNAEGFLPWRDAARGDGIASAGAWPLDVEEGEWVLVMFAGRDHAFDEPFLREGGRAAADGLGHHLSAAQRLDLERILAKALSLAGNPAFIADVEGTIQWSNRAFSHLTGYGVDEIRGRNPRFLSSGQHGPRHYRELWNTIRTGQVWHGETVDRDRDGVAFTAMQTITPFGPADRATHYLAIYEDISRQKNEQVRRALCVGHDPLTNLMHAAALERQMNDAFATGKNVALALVSIRNLSTAVGRLGDDALDNWLEECRTRVRNVVGSGNAAETGAGEFLMRLPVESDAAKASVEKLRESLDEPYPLFGPMPELEVRIGTAASPTDGADVDALKRHADRALGVEPLVGARRALSDRPL